MKKNIILFLIILNAYAVNGQTLNIKGGISISKLEILVARYDFTATTEPLIGYSFLGGLDYFENKYFFISSDLGAIRKGTYNTAEKVGPEVYVDEIKEKVKFDYLTVNTCINARYPINKKLFPYIGVGPRIDFLVKYSRGSHYKKINYGLVLGTGIKYNLLNKFQIGIYSAYNLNFNKIAEESFAPSNYYGPSNYYKRSIQDNTFMILFSFGYKLKQKEE